MSLIYDFETYTPHAEEECSAGQTRIEKLLQQLVAEHQSGLREESIMSHSTIESAEDGDEVV